MPRSTNSRLRRFSVLLFLGTALAPLPALAQTAPLGAIAKRTAGLERSAGFLPFWFDAKAGKLLLEVPLGQDILYYVSAASGGGSVELPLDRGILETAVIRFERIGSRVLVRQVNTDYRSLRGDAAHAEGVAESFPGSVLAVLPLEAEGDGRLVVDATGLFLRDAANIEGDLKRANQGGFRYDAARSSFYPARMKGFPENTEIETLATFVADTPGGLVANVTPDARMVSLRVHHSFLKAPSGYTSRAADPRIGVSTLSFHDYSKPFSEGPETEWITRWRLEKKDPAAALSEPVKPIVFYFDPAIPAPIRTAMKQGLLWWNKSFEAAGFVNAIEARDAAADMDPMDIRYAYVLWINRDERGFSSGGTYRDPRTGEILGSKTRMDTHRIRTIANYWDAYAGGLPGDGSGITVADPAMLTPGAFEGMPAGQRDMVLLRQALLTAHELGHALGFGHNFASSLNDRASVMEYPTPRVKVTDGRIDLSDSFMKAIGAYDTAMVRYAYTPLAPAGEKAGLDRVIADMRGAGLLYVPQSDPRWTWYDDRATPTENLREAMAARAILLQTYGEAGTLQPGEPTGSLRNARLWMVYLHHRYAIESAIKYVGGLFTNITVKGDTLPPTEFIPGTLQRETLELLLAAIEPRNLALPEALLARLTPDPGNNLEDLSKDDAFDQLRSARILAAMVIAPLFDGDKAARMIALGARQKDAVTFAQLVDGVFDRTWGATVPAGAGEQALLRVTQSVALQAAEMLAADADAPPEARAYVLQKLAGLADGLRRRSGSDALATAFYRQTALDVDRYLADPITHAPKSVEPLWGKGPRSRFPQPPGPPL
ncbi:zinc-dependent metalloprotease [Sphingomonas sp. HF-S4]|uniref:Zinc-dependent metalloprotease n=1 Tax=Sphingomonas agrestis TaxID=3080540 RepID=A0ABU3Y629_9SPHN|nr:zinc-dependent metalloprotease [Sphingomonas sp. HF-S4]MDV3456865.1 zinc-dependent metalloprotease [Sphingomonas sp. HF-S4]